MNAYLSIEDIWYRKKSLTTNIGKNWYRKSLKTDIGQIWYQKSTCIGIGKKYQYRLKFWVPSHSGVVAPAPNTALHSTLHPNTATALLLCRPTHVAATADTGGEREPGGIGGWVEL